MQMLDIKMIQTRLLVIIQLIQIIIYFAQLQRINHVRMPHQRVWCSRASHFITIVSLRLNRRRLISTWRLNHSCTTPLMGIVSVSLPMARQEVVKPTPWKVIYGAMPNMVSSHEPCRRSLGVKLNLLKTVEFMNSVVRLLKYIMR